MKRHIRQRKQLFNAEKYGSRDTGDMLSAFVNDSSGVSSTVSSCPAIPDRLEETSSVKMRESLGGLIKAWRGQEFPP